MFIKITRWFGIRTPAQALFQISKLRIKNIMYINIMYYSSYIYLCVALYSYVCIFELNINNFCSF
jgi:hypothetical protein